MDKFFAFFSTFFSDIKIKFVKTLIEDNRWKYLSDGLLITIKVAFFAVLLGIVIGFVVAIIRATNTTTGRLKVLNFFCKLYITVTAEPR